MIDLGMKLYEGVSVATKKGHKLVKSSFVSERDNKNSPKQDGTRSSGIGELRVVGQAYQGGAHFEALNEPPLMLP